MKNIGVVIYTYNRVDDAKINMEIIRNEWTKIEGFRDIKIVHAYNGEKKWYPKKYLEDEIVRIKNSWHFQGASDLIDAGIKKMSENYKNVDYLIVLAADTWIINPLYIWKLVDRMRAEQYSLSTCAWGLPEKNNIREVGMAVDFFVVNLRWAIKYGMFPIDYNDFYQKYGEFVLYQKAGNIMLEKLTLSRYLRAISNEEGFNGVATKKAMERLLIMREREPVHSHIDKEGFWKRYMYWPKMGLLTHHNPDEKKEILFKKGIKKGDNIKKLLKSNRLDYFNSGVAQMEHNCN